MEENNELMDAKVRLGRFSLFRAPIRPCRVDGKSYLASKVPMMNVGCGLLYEMISGHEAPVGVSDDESLEPRAGVDAWARADALLAAEPGEWAQDADARHALARAVHERLREVVGGLRGLASEAEQREWKSARLPYATPCGCFRQRAARYVESLSGLVVLDIDHLESLDEAEEVRDRLFDDPVLRPRLAFVSPSGRGVKLLVPYVWEGGHSVGCYDPEEFELKGWQPTEENLSTVSEQILFGMDYLNMRLQVDGRNGLTRRQMECDFTGKDVSRACFLSYDPRAKIRTVLQ